MISFLLNLLAIVAIMSLFGLSYLEKQNRPYIYDSFPIDQL